MTAPTPLHRALCCGQTCGRGTDASGPCVAATHGAAIQHRAEAAGYRVVPAEATDARVHAAMHRPHTPADPNVYHGIYRAMVTAKDEPADG